MASQSKYPRRDNAERAFRFRADSIAVVAGLDAFARSAVSMLLTEMGSSQVIELASVNEALVHLSNRENIALVVLDLPVPRLEAAKISDFRHALPKAHVIVLTKSLERDDALIALAKGAHGCVPKSLGIEEFRKAVSIVGTGSIYAPALLADVNCQSEEPVIDVPDIRPPRLTPRQQQSLELLVQGKSNKEICRILGLGEGTVKIHVAGVFRALNVTSRAAAAVQGARLQPRPTRQEAPAPAMLA